ncbi:MAG: hypothetical protein WCG75_06920 [Armatimonadota bacterium]
MNLFKKEESVDESKLNSASQLRVASLIKSMPEEDLSLSWRSELNVKLMEIQNARSKRKSTNRYFAFGSSLSAALGVAGYALFMANANTVVTPVGKIDSSGFASELVRTHQESLVAMSVSGTGSAARESTPADDSFDGQDELL